MLNMKKDDYKVLFLVAVWSFFLSIIFLFYFNHINLDEKSSTVQNTITISVIFFLVCIFAIIMLMLHYVRRIMEKIWYTIKLRKEKNISTDISYWLRHEKFAQSEIFLRALNIKQEPFPKDVDTLPKRIEYFKGIIQTSITNEKELENWSLYLKMYDKDFNYGRLLVPIFVSFSTLTYFWEKVPNIHKFSINVICHGKIENWLDSFLSNIFFLELISIVCLVVYGVIYYFSYNSKLLNILSVVVDSIIEEKRNKNKKA